MDVLKIANVVSFCTTPNEREWAGDGTAAGTLGGTARLLG